jgi:hypothetical protein
MYLILPRIKLSDPVRRDVPSCRWEMLTRRPELSFLWNHSYCGLVLFPGGSVVLNNGTTTTSDSSDLRQQWYKYSLVGTVYHVP